MFSENQGQDRFKSFRVFGVLKGPVFSIASVELNGLTGDFEYNSRLALPAASQVAKFLFIATENSLIPPGSLRRQVLTFRTEVNANSDLFI